MRLRAFYAVPKMVVIPSAQALGRRKLSHACERTHAAPQLHTQLVTQLLATAKIREACDLVGRWQLQHAFEPTQLLQRLLQAKQYGAALRFAREFGLERAYPIQATLARMVDDGRYEAILKHVHASAANVDGRGLTPVDVLGKLVGAGKHDVALKYVHKFKADGQFPPAQLVEACLKREGELTVRTCGMLLKFVPKFNLEDASVSYTHLTLPTKRIV